jgi:hypothetical protein
LYPNSILFVPNLFLCCVPCVGVHSLACGNVYNISSLRLPKPTEPMPSLSLVQAYGWVRSAYGVSESIGVSESVHADACQTTKKEIGHKKNWIWVQKKCSIFLGTKKIEFGHKKNIMP